MGSEMCIRDRLYGGLGDDVLKGGMASDILNGGSGDDELYGGDGADIFQFEQVVNTDFIRDFTSDDTIEFMYEDGVDDNSQASVSINEANGNTQVSWGAVSIMLDNYTSFTIDDFTFTMI